MSNSKAIPIITKDFDSRYFAMFHSDDFDAWWNPRKFDYQNASDKLLVYCYKHFDKWWNPKKFNWKHSGLLVEYCRDNFDKWWDPKKFDFEQEMFLALYCLDHIKEWSPYVSKDVLQFALSKLSVKQIAKYKL